MKQRNVFAVFALPLVTFGLYGLYWIVSTKREMVTKGANIPTSLLIIVPIINIWWLWKYCEGVGMVTDQKLSPVMAFLVSWLLGSIGNAIIQDSFNKVTDVPVTAQAYQPAATAPYTQYSPQPEQPQTPVVSQPPVEGPQPPTSTPPNPQV